jgi:hypothetical protein
MAVPDEGDRADDRRSGKSFWTFNRFPALPDVDPRVTFGTDGFPRNKFLPNNFFVLSKALTF